MADQSKKAYQRLKELHHESESADYSWTKSGKSTEWKQSVQGALRRMFGDGSPQLEQFKNVRYSPIVFGGGSDAPFRGAFASGISQAQGIIRAALREYEDYEMPKPPPKPIKIEALTPGYPLSGDIFLVHGHDDAMRETVARFLERLELNPIILQERPSAGNTVIEKFEGASDVAFAVVLLSPDDVGNAASSSDELRARARQNVILELGYFVARLGRPRVCPLVKGELDLPSDIHGIVYVPFEGESWKLQLVRELKHAGFEIDADKIL